MPININGITQNRYTTIVDYNDGEGQLVIVQSLGQNGWLSATVIDVKCDGDMEIYLEQYRPDRLTKTIEQIRLAVVFWRSHEKPFRPVCAVNDVQRIMNFILTTHTVLEG